MALENPLTLRYLALGLCPFTIKEVRINTKKDHRNDEDFILVDDIILPEGLEVTLDDIFNTKNSDMITVDKDNLLQSGVI